MAYYGTYMTLFLFPRRGHTLHSHPSERIFAFIDGPNLHATVRALGFEIDYRKLLEYLRSQGNLVRVLYYTAIVEDQEFSTFRPLADWLDYNGYTMVTKPARGYTDSTGRRRFRTSMDVELAVDAMRLADKADHVILFSGEQSFSSLVNALQQAGKRVTVVSTIETQPAMVADDLRRAADQFIDIDSLQTQIARQGRPPRPMPQSTFDRDERQRRDDDEEDRNPDEPRAAVRGFSEARFSEARTGTSPDQSADDTPRVAPELAVTASEATEAREAEGAAAVSAGPTVVRTPVRRRRTTP